MMPHAEVLHTGIAETDLLGSMTAKYGKIFFWDTFDHILFAAQGKLIEKALLEAMFPEHLSHCQDPWKADYTEVLQNPEASCKVF